MAKKMPLLIDWSTAGEVLGAKMLSPLYWALIWCRPSARVEVVKVAVPALRRTGGPSGVVPSKKVTMPVGVPDPAVSALTVAVKVTGRPGLGGRTEHGKVTTVMLPGVIWLAGVTLMPVWVPWMPEATSVAVSDWTPGVFKVALNVWV